jgi:D-sedoheptulose 7-phosphate isomerase
MDVRGATKIIIEAFKKGNKLLIIGNGGSAAEAQHMAGELVGKFKYVRCALPAISLTTDTSVITSISNDFGFEYIFSRQIEALGESGDVLFTLSTSGKSKNILRAIDTAKSIGMEVIDLDRVGKNTPRIQEFQLLQIHKICESVEKYFYLDQFEFFRVGVGSKVKLMAKMICPKCKKERLVQKQRVLTTNFTKKCQHCFNTDRCLEKNPLWKGGTTKQKTGYVWKKLSRDDKFFEMAFDNGYVPEHRYVMATKLGRPLKCYEQVHHINCIKDDNRPDNLELVNATEHLLITKMQIKINELEEEIRRLK